MTIDEAIKHAREVAEKKYTEGMLCHANPNDDLLDGYISCAEEHEQIAEWLEELKELRNTTKKGGWILCDERLPEESESCILGWDRIRNRRVFIQYWKGIWSFANCTDVDIVAWQPLPKLYKEEF